MPFQAFLANLKGFLQVAFLAVSVGQGREDQRIRIRL